MKLLTVLYLMGGITLFGVILLMMNLTDSGSMLDNLKTQVVYEPDNLSTLSYDKIILVTSADKLSRDPVRNKESRDSVRNTWMKDLGSRETHGVFFVCILTGTDNEVQRKLVHEAEKEKDMVILRTPSNPNQYSSGNVAAMDWARDRFNYNVMLTVDHMTLVNISELDTQIEVIGKYNITGDSPLSKGQNLHIWSSGTLLGFDKIHTNTNNNVSSGLAGIRELVGDKGLVTTKLDGFYSSRREFCKAGATYWIVIRSLDATSMERIWGLFSEQEDICKEVEPRQSDKKLKRTQNEI